MTKVIEILVIGEVGSGKSHVLELIDKALRAEYGHHVQIASHDLSTERGLGSPGDRPRVSETIFSLREQGAHVTNEAAARMRRNLREAAAKAPEPAAIQGEAMSFMLDPLEQAIESTVRMMRDEHQQMTEVGAKEDTALCDRLGSHLDALLAIQIERVTADETV